MVPIPPRWLFRCAKLAVLLEVPFSRHDRKMMGWMVQALEQGGQPCSSAAARNHLVYRKWRNYLVYGWPGWKERWKDLVKLEGEGYLLEALAQRRGAILLSGHRFGYEVLLAPVLSLCGYRVHRTGRGADSARRVARWGERGELGWKYINYGDDPWSRLRALKQMQRAMSQNEPVHVSIRTHRAGPAGAGIELFGRRCWLDPNVLKVIELLQAPVLPAFCYPNEDGEISIEIYPPLRPETGEIVRSFGSLYARHLKSRPEASRAWRRVRLGWEAW